MASLLFGLPPLAPDYSGVASALHDLGALVIIHDASGCTGTYTGYDEPRWFGSSSPIFCSGLREMDAVLGDDEKLVQKIRLFLEENTVPFISVIGSPVPMLVGFDFNGFASLVQNETGVPVLAFPTNGLHHYDAGLSDAFLKLYENFSAEHKQDLPRTINILGASPLDGFDEIAVSSLKRLAGEAGLQVLSVWGQESSCSELEKVNAASLNWVVDCAALPLARRMKESCNIPYVCGLPVGSAETGRLFRIFEEAYAGVFRPSSAFPSVAHVSPDTSLPRVLLVTERVRGASVRAFLINEGLASQVCVGSFFAADEDLYEEGDLLFHDESDVVKAFSEAWDVVIADPLFKIFLPADIDSHDRASLVFIELPHAAVSGRLYKDSCAHLCVSGMPLLLEPLTAISSSRM